MAMTTEAPTALVVSEQTYDAYMAEPEVQGRYDIVNGVRIFMSGASLRHQRIADCIARFLYAFEQKSGLGISVSAPYDVLIKRFPRIQTRQPDVLFVSHARMAQSAGDPEVGPLEVAPELVVEVISNSGTQRILGDKIADYISIGADECWVVRPADRTVEVLTLTLNGAQSVAIYDEGQTVSSIVFPGLTVSVADVLAA
ncbi:MAG: Uma2 family endonuclease [Janthinobacterium lividum]